VAAVVLCLRGGYDCIGNRTYELETVSTSCPAAISPASVNSYSGPSGSRYNWSQFASNNRVSSTTVNSASTSFTYDAAGNVTFDGLNHYVYDTDGRISSPQTKTRLRGPLLCAVWSSGPLYTQYLQLGVPVDRSWSTGRDAEGRFVAKGAIPAIDWPTAGATCNPPLAGTGFASTALYLRGMHGDQDTELTGSGGSWVHTNIFANGGVTATFWNSSKGPDTSYTFSDWLGSKRLQTDSNPVAEAYWQSDPYGDYLNYNGSGGDATEHHFTGKERDGTPMTESGNDYFQARYYNSSVGRFLSPDWSAKVQPIPYSKLDNPQSLNLYAYVDNNPLGAIDPDGHAAQTGKGSFQSCADDEAIGVCNTSADTFKESDAITEQIAAAQEQQKAAQAQQQISLDRLTTILYHEMGSLTPDPNSKSVEAGSAEDLHNGRVAVGEVILSRFHTKHHRIGIDIASDVLSSDEKRAIKNGVPAVVSALADTRAAAQVAYNGSNTMHGALQYRTRYNGDITGNLGRTRSNPGTPLSAHFGPFINSTGGTAVEVIAP